LANNPVLENCLLMFDDDRDYVILQQFFWEPWEMHLGKMHLYFLETAANFVEINQALKNAIEPEPARSTQEIFKTRLHDMINARTDGRQIYTASRVASVYM
jgi:type II secretory pathway component PulM